jgi:hypothetical protein
MKASNIMWKDTIFYAIASAYVSILLSIITTTTTDANLRHGTPDIQVSYIVNAALVLQFWS